MTFISFILAVGLSLFLAGRVVQQRVEFAALATAIIPVANSTDKSKGKL